jgi:hypothetical protein
MLDFTRRVLRGDWEALTKCALVAGAVGALISLMSSVYSSAQPYLLWFSTIGAISFLFLLFFAIIRSVHRTISNRRYHNESYDKEFAKFSDLISKNATGTTSNPLSSISREISTLYCGYRGIVARDKEPAVQIDMKAILNGMNAKREELDNLLESVKTRRSDILRETASNEDNLIGYFNRPHAVVLEEDIPSSYSQSMTSMPYQKCDYVGLHAIIDALSQNSVAFDSAESIPYVLGAGGFLVYPKFNELYFLMRSSRNDTYPFRLHVFGGNFEPNVGAPWTGYDRDLKANAEREIFEESGTSVEIDDSLMFVHKEVANPAITSHVIGDTSNWRRLMKYIPVHYCGIVIDEKQYRRLEERIKDRAENMPGEGTVYPIEFSGLQKALENVEMWVPVAWYSIMLWLYLGAPCQNGEPIFNRSRARRLFRSVIRSMSHGALRSR